MEDDSDYDEFSVQPYMYEPEFSDSQSDFFLILTRTARKILPMPKTTIVLGIRIGKYIILLHAGVGKNKKNL